MKRGHWIPPGQMDFGGGFDIPLSLPRSGPGVCGIDEAGRGPLAGPVVAACVVLSDSFPEGILDDSKALSEVHREEAFALIVRNARSWSAGFATHGEIDDLNILQATFLAMRRAWLCLPFQPPTVYIDGPYAPDLGPGEARFFSVIGGDALLAPVMAASIVAKVLRDRAMARFDTLYPGYGYARHRGYPTLAHRAACERLGISPIQRKTFTCRAP